MNFADAAVEILSSASGGPLHYRDITDRACVSGIINPRSETPWTYMASALLQDIRRRQRRGESPRFVSVGRGYYRLHQPLSVAESAVLASNEGAKEKLRRKLHDLDPIAFESLVADLLERAGFEEIEQTQASGDGGIDIRGMLTVGGLARVVTAIQVKRWRKNVPIEIVRALRGSLNPTEQGLVVTLSDFTKDAVIEATAPGRAPIGLLNGAALVDLLAEHGLGFVRKEVVLLAVDEELFSGRLEQAENAEPLRVGSALPQSIGSGRFGIFKVPGGISRQDALNMMLQAVRGQLVTEYVESFVQTFPNITRTYMAERYMRVLIALGLADISDERIVRTADGAEYLSGNDGSRLAILRSAFSNRLYGGLELLEEDLSLSESELFERLKEHGLERLTKTQLGYLMEWRRALWPVAP